MAKDGILFALGLVSLLLSGCAGSGGPATPKENEEPMAPATPGEESGAIQGIVTDPELDPIPGAQVAIQGGESDPVVTPADGRFAFSDVSPGRRTVFVTALGYSAQARAVEVAAGAISDLSFTLERLATLEPYSVLEVKKGFISCGTGTPVVTQVACGSVDANQRFIFDYPVAENITGVLFEQDWQPAQLLSRDLLLRVEKDGCGLSCGASDTFGDAEGCCYLRISLDESQLKLPAGTMPAADLPETGGILQSRTFPAFGESTVPATLFVNQEFTLYIEYFYNGNPSDFESRTNVPES